MEESVFQPSACPLGFQECRECESVRNFNEKSSAALNEGFCL